MRALHEHDRDGEPLQLAAAQLLHLACQHGPQLERCEYTVERGLAVGPLRRAPLEPPALP